MSVYTTEVRYICEFEAGCTESHGYSDIDEIIEKSWDKIFKTTWPIFNEEYRKTLCTKILQHYYTREICAETVGLWKYWLNVKMNEIMPYYNQLYKSAQIEFDPFNEINFTREITEDSLQNKNGDNLQKGSSSNTNDSQFDTSRTYTNDVSREINSIETQDQTNTTQTDSGGKNLHSDTPQGSIQNIAENGYLTDATLTDNSTSSTNTADSTKNTSGTETEKSTEKTIGGDSTHENSISENSDSNVYTEALKGAKSILEKYHGKNSSTSYSKLIDEYRQTILNIDLEIILSLSDLFMNIY